MILENHNVVIRKDHREMTEKVKLLTGGKIGHEPMFFSYVAEGMLTAAVMGSAISPPSSRDIYLCLKQLSANHKGGILAIVPNSSEEIINFALAIEKARCEGVVVDMVPIGDDVWDSAKTKRRCLAGITLAFKIAGAMAEMSLSMEEIFFTLKYLWIGTMSCSLIENEAIIGTNLEGKTGEPVETDSLPGLISKMLDFFFDRKKYFSIPIQEGSNFLLMVNCYLSNRLFLYKWVEETYRQLSSRGVHIPRVMAGNFVSGPAGFSITLLKTNQHILNYVDARTACQVWPKDPARITPVVVDWPSLPKQVYLEPIGPFVENTNLVDIPLM